MAMRVGPLIAAVAAVASLTACGDEEPAKAAIDPGFLEKANTACAAGIARHENQEPFPLKNFDREHPDAADLPIVAAYFEKYDDLDTVATDLSALGDPRTGREQWRQLLDLAQRLSVNARTQRQAARAQDIQAFVRMVHEGDDIHDQIRRLGPAAGFSSTSACGKYYG